MIFLLPALVKKNALPKRGWFRRNQDMSVIALSFSIY
jgi:hypothetical protein